LKERKHPAVFRYVERLHGEQPWGAILDAGSGTSSIRWIQSLATERWTAVTGSAAQADQIRSISKATQRPQDHIAVGNWADPQFLKSEPYDTVLADYLVGSIEGFAPYFQSYLFERLRLLTGNRLYVVGLEPYVPTTPPNTKAGRLLWEIGRYRDACVLIAGGLPYREYPLSWVVDRLQRSGFEVQSVKHFQTSYQELFVKAQIGIATSGLKTLSDHNLAQALRARGEALHAQSLDVISAEGALRAGRKYVIAAKPI